MKQFLIHEPGLLFRQSLASKMVSVKRVSPKRHSNLSGLIEHRGGASLIEIKNLTNPLILPPSINCREPWIRRSASWHYESQNSCFCWVLQKEWAHHFSERRKAGESVGVMCSDAATWLVDAMSIVLSRHWSGHKLGLFDWPEEWEDYSHGDAGVQEYEAGKFN